MNSLTATKWTASSTNYFQMIASSTHNESIPTGVFKVSLNKIRDEFGVTKLELIAPLTVTIRKNADGYFLIDFSDADIYIAEKSHITAIEMFHANFLYAWKEFVEVEEAAINPGALELRNWLLNNARKAF